MNTVNITDSEIESYLLGAVEGDTAESIDELTFLDENFAARVDAVERDLIDGYLREELDANSVQQFEIFYLKSAKRREKMRLGASFGEFVAASGPNIQHPIRAEPAAETKEPSFRWWKFAIPAFVAAAILLAVAVPFWLNSTTTQEQANSNVNLDEIVQVQPTTTLSPSIQPTPSPSGGETAVNRSVPPANENRRVDPPSPRVFAITLLPQTRGSQRAERILMPKNTDRLSVAIKLEPNDFSSVLVELRDQASGSVIWRSNARPSPIVGGYQTVKVGLNADLLKQGSYTFRVSAAAEGLDREIVGDYPLTIVR